MVQVVPAIIPKNFKDLVDKIEIVKDFVPLIQVDVFNGTLSESLNWPYENSDDLDFKSLVTGEKTLPYKDKLKYEIDVTLTNPEDFISDWITIGTDSLIVHVEGTLKMQDIIDKCKTENISVGIAISPSTPNEALNPYISQIDFIQCMGNDKVGYHGVTLEKAVLKKISDLRTKFPECTIGIDIGVTRETAPLLIQAGANKLISGSAIFGSDNIEDAVKALSLSDIK